MDNDKDIERYTRERNWEAVGNAIKRFQSVDLARPWEKWGTWMETYAAKLEGEDKATCLHWAQEIYNLADTHTDTTMAEAKEEEERLAEEKDYEEEEEEE